MLNTFVVNLYLPYSSASTNLYSILHSLNDGQRFRHLYFDTSCTIPPNAKVREYLDENRESTERIFDVMQEKSKVLSTLSGMANKLKYPTSILTLVPPKVMEAVGMLCVTEVHAVDREQLNKYRDHEIFQLIKQRSLLRTFE